ncbi:hypothetical protein U9M48_036099 [Paspalum notatum var. saurae]|uniref:Uncharacterized protein n=1 Tax=Paspalum notatum var. saurae TaxID=547442 RepID=A0AAQ3UDX1_PASNO
MAVDPPWALPSSAPLRSSSGGPFYGRCLLRPAGGNRSPPMASSRLQTFLRRLQAPPASRHCSSPRQQEAILHGRPPPERRLSPDGELLRPPWAPSSPPSSSKATPLLLQAPPSSSNSHGAVGLLNPLASPSSPNSRGTSPPPARGNAHQALY